ncbi:MAG: hypothetical protein U0694_02875 [Anaerolineae bacterium]
MAANVKWESEEQKVIVFTFENYWTLDEYYDVLKQSNVMMDQVQHKVNMIIDVRASKSVPSGFMSALRTVSKHPHANSGKVAMIGMSPFIRAFILAVRQVLRKKPEDSWMTIVNNYQEAHDLFRAEEKVNT